MSIATGQSDPTDMAIDGTYLYWTDSQGGAVMRWPLAGGSVTTFASTGAPYGIASDGTNVYWGSAAYPGTIYRCPVSGCGTPVAVATSQTAPQGVAVDSQYVYWANENGGWVARCPIGSTCGSSPLVLASGLDTPFGVAAHAGTAFFTEAGSSPNIGKVYACSGAGCGGAPTTIASGLFYPYAITTDASGNVYWAAGGSLYECPGGSCPGGATVLATGFSEPEGIATDGTSLYFTDYGAQTVNECTIASCSSTVVTLAKGQTGAQAIVVDSKYVYWADDVLSGSVQRVAK